MRTREEIEKLLLSYNTTTEMVMLELLLDIREILLEQNKPIISGSANITTSTLDDGFNIRPQKHHPTA